MPRVVDLERNKRPRHLDRERSSMSQYPRSYGRCQFHFSQARPAGRLWPSPTRDTWGHLSLVKPQFEVGRAHMSARVGSCATKLWRCADAVDAFGALDSDRPIGWAVDGVIDCADRWRRRQSVNFSLARDVSEVVEIDSARPRDGDGHCRNQCRQACLHPLYASR